MNWNKGKEKDLADARVYGTESVLKACRDFELKKCIFTSSMDTVLKADSSIYMYTPTHWADEKAKEISVGTRGKIQAEAKIWDFRDNLPLDSSLKLLTINPGLVLGTFFPSNPRPDFVQNTQGLLIGGVRSLGNQEGCSICVED